MAAWGERHGYFDTPADAQAFYDEMVYMLATQMAAPNSPQWFNTGLHAVYGIEGPPQGHYYADPNTGEVKLSDSAYERPQPHACQPWDAPVSTPRGPMPIGKIVEEGLVGLEVFDGTGGGAGTTKVVAVKANGVKPVLRVVLKNGTSLDATGDHLVWARDERRQEGSWRPMDQLAAGMRLELVGGEGRPGLREEAIVRIEELGAMPVYDIQTESSRYLSNNVVVHNCFIQSIEDDLVNEGGIMDLIAREARIFKYGSGTGSNFSRLRGRKEPLSGGGISSGVLSFLRVNDRSASSIKSGGTTRRAAKMVILDADHPDISEYIDWKVTEEHKVAAMVTGSRVLRRHTRRVLQACRPPPHADGNGRPVRPEGEPRARRGPAGRAGRRGARLLPLPARAARRAEAGSPAWRCRRHPCPPAGQGRCRPRSWAGRPCGCSSGR